MVDDARTAVARQPTGDFDLVIGDAFGHLVVPWHLTTNEFVEDIRRVLRPGGSYALNVIDYPPTELIRAEIATVRAVFANVAVVAPTRALNGVSGANFVVLASDEPLPLADLRDRMAALPSPTSVLSGAELDAFVGDAQVLTDDYAPVDQLLTHAADPARAAASRGHGRRPTPRRSPSSRHRELEVRSAPVATAPVMIPEILGRPELADQSEVAGGGADREGEAGQVLGD